MSESFEHLLSNGEIAHIEADSDQALWALGEREQLSEDSLAVGYVLHVCDHVQCQICAVLDEKG